MEKNQISEEERLTWGLLVCCEPVIGAACLRKIKQGLENIQAKVTDFWRTPSEFRQWLGQEEKKLAVIQEIKKVWTREKLAQYLERNQVGITVMGESDYPLLLRYIPDFAPALFYQGELAVTAKPTLAVVGSRKVTAGGAAAVRYLLDETARNLTIVSGMMVGVDRLAHERAVEIGASTVAVLGYGMERTWPVTLTRLREEIVATGGLILSEYAPWSEPLPQRFPIRNRLVAGLSLATLVIEAAAKSGSLITANLAVDYGREVLAVPGSIFNENAQGCHELLRQGAVLAGRPEVILETILTSKVNCLPQAFYQELAEKQEKTPAKWQEKEFSDPVQNKIYGLLGRRNLTLEQLSQELEIELAEVMSSVSLLELAGEIEQSSDGEWKLAVL